MNILLTLFSLADFCYGNEDLTFSISEAIKLCVTVVAYAPESFRRYRNKPRIIFTSSFIHFSTLNSLSLQSPDADGPGGSGPVPPTEAEEQHHHNGVGISCQG